jgi:phage-related protein
MEINIKKLREIINSSQKMKYYRNPNYYYHAKFIPLLEDINPIFSIIDNGILSLSELKKHV